MHLPFEPAVVQYLIVIVAALAVSAAVGVKRGWRGQLLAFAPIVAVWGLLGVEKDALVRSVNVVYRGLRFFLACGTQADTGSCVQSADLAQAVLVDPANPEHVRLLLLAVFVSAVALVFLLVMRFGRRPTSVFHRLLGVVLGVANGFTLSYLVLPLLPYGQKISLPVASATADGELSVGAPSLPGSVTLPGASLGVIVLVAFVVFVVLAVRLMKPIEA